MVNSQGHDESKHGQKGTSGILKVTSSKISVTDLSSEGKAYRLTVCRRRSFGFFWCIESYHW